MAKIVINGKECNADAGGNILQVLIREGIDVPYLCYHEALSSYGACRLCMVEVTSGSRKGIMPSCTLAVTEGLAVETESPGVVRIRKILLEMYLAEAPGSEKIRELARKYGVETSRFSGFDVSEKGDRCCSAVAVRESVPSFSKLAQLIFQAEESKPASIPLA